MVGHAERKTMSLQFRKAERSKAKLRLGLSGPAGSGKTWNSLTIAKGLGGKTALIDTENGSGDLYASSFDYDILQIQAPFTPEKYVAAIKAAEEAGYDNIIIDSLSHAWAGEGGVLDLQGKAADKEKNSYTAWRHVTPRHNSLVEALLQSKCHVIATMRSKVEYILTEVTNKSGGTSMAPKKVGMAPVQREGLEYEFTAVLDIDIDHDAKATKDRTGLFASPDPIRISEDTGKALKAWLESGKEVVAPIILCSNHLKKGEEVPYSEVVDEQAFCSECTTKYKQLNNK